MKGNIYFSAKDVRADRLGHMDIVAGDHYTHPALIPVTAASPATAPPRGQPAAARPQGDGVQLTWRGAGTSYAVYRFDGADVAVGPCDLADATHLVGTTRDDDLDRRRPPTRDRVHLRRHRAGPRLPRERAQQPGVGSRGLRRVLYQWSMTRVEAGRETAKQRQVREQPRGADRDAVARRAAARSSATSPATSASPG